MSEVDALPQRVRRKRTRSTQHVEGDDISSQEHLLKEQLDNLVKRAPPAHDMATAPLVVPNVNDRDEDTLQKTCGDANIALSNFVYHKQYEYLDHTADVQLHAWGDTLNEALAQICIAMFGYMTELEYVEIDENCSFILEARGHDMLSLIFHLLDELLYVFSTTDRVVKECKVLDFTEHQKSADGNNFSVRIACRGERFSLEKHPQGTEIKAITYSNMQVHGIDDKDAKQIDIYVIVDI